MKTIYYAHPISIYDTPQETRDISLLRSLGLEPVNPNQAEWQEEYKRRGMEFFIEKVRECDGLAFRGLMDGSIPAGIKKEIDKAMDLNFPIIELPTAINRRSLTLDETREALLQCGQR